MTRGSRTAVATLSLLLGMSVLAGCSESADPGSFPISYSAASSSSTAPEADSDVDATNDGNMASDDEDVTGAEIDLSTTARSLTELLDGAGLATVSNGLAGFTSVGEDEHGKFAIAQSNDGVSWTTLAGRVSGLPGTLAGPYRLWVFGDGYLLYGTSGFDDQELLGPDPFVAISADLLAWQEVELPGIDPLFYGNWPQAHGPGDVNREGSLAYFSGFNRASESGAGFPVAWVLRPGREPVLLDRGQTLFEYSFVGDELVGLGYDRARRLQLGVLDGEHWRVRSMPPANLALVSQLYAVGSSLLFLNAGESWSSPDAGVTWNQIDTIPSEIRSFGYFGAFAAAGPPEPPFGTPETFPFSTDAAVWIDIPLPEGASSVRHLTSGELGLLSLVEFSAPQRYETILTTR